MFLECEYNVHLFIPHLSYSAVLVQYQVASFNLYVEHDQLRALITSAAHRIIRMHVELAVSYAMPFALA